MSTKMMLELKRINSTEVIIHLDAMMFRSGASSSYVSARWARENHRDDLFTDVGNDIVDSLSTLPGVSVMYGCYGMIVEVPEIFVLQDVLWDILCKIVTVLDDNIAFATTLGDNAFTKPEFILNPSREAFDDNINTMLVELGQHKNLDIVEAERTIERLSQTLGDLKKEHASS